MARKKAQTKQERLRAFANTFRGMAKLFKVKPVAFVAGQADKTEQNKSMAQICEGLAEVCDNMAIMEDVKKVKT